MEQQTLALDERYTIPLCGGVLARIEFHDKGPDEQGRRHYSLHWPDFRDRPIYMGGKVVAEAGAFERGQHSFGVPPIAPSEVQR